MQGTLGIPQYEAEDLADLFRARSKFIESGEVEDAVRPVVRQSWQRSKAHGVDPHRLSHQCPDPERLAKLLETHCSLVEAALPVLQEMRATVQGSPHVIALGNPEGLILNLSADPPVGAETNLFAGASWHEQALGCNGVGTALEAKEPVILIGPEHFQETYVGWTCIGVPIFGRDGAVAGVLDLSVPNEAVNVHTWGWALSAGRAIEARLWAALPEQGAAPLVPPLGDDPFETLRGVLTLLGRQADMPSHRSLLSTGLQQLERARAMVEGAAGELQAIRRAVVDDERSSARLVANLGHELRNPLAAIAASVDLLSQDVRGGEDAKDALAVLRRQVEVLLRLADDTSEAVRARGGELRVQMRRLDARWVATRAAEVVRPQVEQRGQTLAWTPAGPPLWVEGDDVRLEQVLVNLLVNASKYTQPGGCIELCCDRAGDDVSLSVADDGQGIAPDDLPHIFEPFRRGRWSVGGNGNDLGLGLALVRTLVELHGGCVTAESPGSGRGSTFRVRLPLAREGGQDF